MSAKNHIFFITKPVSGIRFKNICLYIKKNSYIFVHMSSVKAYEGGGLSALADMFSKNVRFFLDGFPKMKNIKLVKEVLKTSL